MADIPNVTGRIAELREFKKARSLGRSSDSRPPRPPEKPVRRAKMAPSRARALRERAVAPSYFTVGVYALLFVGLVAQLFFITLLDLL